MTPERKKAFEIFRLFDAIGMEWRKARSCCSLIHINMMIALEKKHSNMVEVEFLKKVELEIQTI